MEGFILAAMAVALPAGMYAAMHAAVLLRWLHLWSMLLLGGLPLLYLTLVRDGLWWLPGPPALVRHAGEGGGK